jgi:hypothetical protein
VVFRSVFAGGDRGADGIQAVGDLAVSLRHVLAAVLDPDDGLGVVDVDQEDARPDLDGLLAISGTHRVVALAAPDVGDVLTLKKPRTDDPLKGVAIPISKVPHPAQSQPSVIEKLHAKKVSYLPLRNDKGTYDQHTPPDLSSSAAISDYIQTRTAAWTQHLERLRQRRKNRLSNKKH